MAARPLEYNISLNITNECNQNCIFCKANETFPKMEKISKENFLKVIEWAESYTKAKDFEFCGGEPTLHEELIDFIRIAYRKGFNLRLLTNGTRLRKIAKDLKEYNVSVQVSVEAPFESLHNRIVGRNSFREVIEGIKEALRIGVDVSTNTTMNRLNLNHVLETILFVRKLGIRKHSINYLVPNPANLEHALDYKTISEMYKKIRYYSDIQGIVITTLNPIPKCIGFNDKQCSAGISCTIEPNLDVYPCLFTQFEDLKMGNLAEDTPEALMESRGYRIFRELPHLPEECRRCRYLKECKGGCYCFWRFKLLKPCDIKFL